MVTAMTGMATAMTGTANTPGKVQHKLQVFVQLLHAPVLTACCLGPIMGHSAQQTPQFFVLVAAPVWQGPACQEVPPVELG